MARAKPASASDAGFSPRLDYYTGIVFEMTGPNGEVLASGGQYDRLLERLGATAPIAASGCSVWVDRLEAEISLMSEITLAVPSKGRLEELTRDWFASNGLTISRPGGALLSGRH
ncbi:ATP phosphoribosyltransferase regulatory subunit [Devosia sp. A8/3-2]|nr:ATP phosphoribosyltransferase regulatory subunit [Devosia sp. A8/3-2]